MATSQMINLKLSRDQLASLLPILEQLSNPEDTSNQEQQLLPVYQTPVRGADYRRGQSISPAGSTPASTSMDSNTISSPESDSLYLSDCSKTKNSRSSNAHSFVHVS